MAGELELAQRDFRCGCRLRCCLGGAVAIGAAGGRLASWLLPACVMMVFALQGLLGNTQLRGGAFQEDRTLHGIR